MFSGIVEEAAEVVALIREEGNLHFAMDAYDEENGAAQYHFSVK